MLPLLATIVLAMTSPATPPAIPVTDALVPLRPVAVHLDGWLSRRVDANTRRLLAVDLEPLLAGFRRKPGSHPWIGEHIGKWMHAAMLAWEYADGETKTQLRAKLDYAAAELIKAQEKDGYLGTYTPETRFGLYPNADWDVWSHKYSMIGLISYANATGNAEALAAARRAGDLLIETFGSGERSIITAGTHVGMAATSVIEPLVLLYRATGERKYLDFALHVVKSYDDPGGPRLLESLLTHGTVARTANGKAYEMLSNCVGLCELHRATGERRFLDAARNAFDDVVANQLYITGTASHHEHFHEGHDLPNAMSANVGETCVTVTWIQLCEQLLRITGEPKYADELERAVYNHLLAAQHPARGDWCYYTSLDGTKPYTAETCCCLSSGPRAASMIPSLVFLTEGADTLIVNLFESATADVELAGSTARVTLSTSSPLTPGATLTIAPMRADAMIGIKIRVPAWAEPVTTDGVSARDGRGWLQVPPRKWTPGEPLRISFSLATRLRLGAFSNAGKAAVTRGPLVMCYQQDPGSPPPSLIWIDRIDAGHDGGGALAVTARALSPLWGEPRDVRLIPFADAGAGGERYRVWLGAPGTLDRVSLSLLRAGAESRSAPGNVSGFINDADPASFVVTFDNTRHAEDWFAVEGAEPVEFRRVVFTHGRTFHDGGWFDASSGPPRVEIKPEAASGWRPLGALTSYPRTTSTDPAGLKGGESFELRLDTPVRAVGVRVIGIPAHGTNPAQSFASCAELSVFVK